MSYPYRNPRVQIDLPQPDPDSRLILNHETGKYLRLGLREFNWLNLFDGQRHVREFPALLGQEEALVQELVRRMAAAKLICLSDEPVELQPIILTADSTVKTKRVEWTSFGQLRIHLGQPKAFLDRIAPVTRPFLSRVGIMGAILFSLLGLALALSQGSEFVAAVRNFPWHLGQTITVIALIFATTVLHELGHAVVCHYFGAPVRSLGLMIFYLQPAAYADVTDSWQLKNRWHRVAISAAGVYVQAIIASAAVMLWSVMRLTGHAAGGDMVVIFVALNLALIAFNVLPFTRLDGYWMLSNIVGIPNLRDRAMEWVRASMRAALTRRPIDPKRLRYNGVLAMPALDRTLLGAFGMTAIVFGTSMWIGGLGFLFRIARWLHFGTTRSFFAVGAFLAVMGGVFVGSRLLAARRAARRAAQPATGPRRPAVSALSAVVKHVIDPQRAVRLNPHLLVVENGDGTITFAWSTPDALTVEAPPSLFDALPLFRNGSTTMAQLTESPFWTPQIDSIVQRLWHGRHLRYASDWELPAEHIRYSRQLGWLSNNTQVRGKEADVLARLRDASVTLLGVGGLGTHVAWNLAACGIGEIHLVDGDTIELTNLNRQLFYTPDDIGQRKVDVCAERLRQFNPQIRVRTTHQYLNNIDDLYKVCEGSSFVVRAIDSPEDALRWVNEVCVRLGIPYSGAGFFPQGTVVGPTVIPGESSCLACNFEPIQRRFDRGTGGTLAPLVFSTAGLLANEVVTYLGGFGTAKTIGRVLAIDAPALNFSYSDIPRNPACAVCGQQEERRAIA